MARQINLACTQVPPVSKKNFPKKTHAKLRENRGIPTPKRMRSPEEAIKIALENIGLIGVGMYKWGFNNLPERYKEDARTLLLLSLIHAAQYWDERKQKLSTYAVSDMRRCKREIYNLINEIRISTPALKKIIWYLNWKKENPKGKLEEFAKEHKLTMKQVNSMLKALPVFFNSKHSIDGGRFFNGQFSDNGGSGSTDFRTNESVPTNEIDLDIYSKMHSPAEADINQKTAKKGLHFLIEEALNPMQQKVLRMRMDGHGGWEGMSLKEIGSKFCLSRERIRQIEHKAKQTLLNHYPDLLREFLDAFSEEPRS